MTQRDYFSGLNAATRYAIRNEENFFQGFPPNLLHSGAPYEALIPWIAQRNGKAYFKAVEGREQLADFAVTSGHQHTDADAWPGSFYQLGSWSFTGDKTTTNREAAIVEPGWTMLGGLPVMFPFSYQGPAFVRLRVRVSVAAGVQLGIRASAYDYLGGTPFSFDEIRLIGNNRALSGEWVEFTKKWNRFDFTDEGFDYSTAMFLLEGNAISGVPYIWEAGLDILDPREFPGPFSGGL